MKIRPCAPSDVPAILAVVNDAAQAYKGIIPADRWHEPYLQRQALEAELRAGVRFWGAQGEGGLAGVMGLQDRGEIDLIRHAYVRSAQRNRGIGAQLLHFLEEVSGKPILIGTWTAATWAIRFYEKHGYRVLGREETTRLLRAHWDIPDRQIETSVVLASPAWKP